MEQGKLKVFKSKKGKLIVKVILDNAKEMPAPTGFIVSDESINGKQVELERVEGQIVQIACEGEVLYFSHQQKSFQTTTIITSNHDSSEMITEQLEQVNYPAKAPYNFIPLNEKVVEAEEIPALNTYHADRLTGWIELDIETITPVYIRDNLTTEQMKQQREAEKKKERYINSDFYSPCGQIRIPGSSLRGMIRNLVEIVTFGKFGFFDDKGLYFRGLADRSNLRKEYQDRMSSYDKRQRKAQYKMSAGFIRRKGFDYYIKPAASYKQILKSEARRKVQYAGKVYEQFNYYKLPNECIVVSGDMPNKKRDWVIYSSSSNEEIKIPDIDIYNYKNDTNRSELVSDLLKLAEGDEVPCFYVIWHDESGRVRISFGHTGMFRLAYEKSISQHIPENLKDENKIDLAEAIFGNEKTFAGRVFFEDVVLKDGQDDVLMPENYPKILSSPKPTTFQHYLVQNSNDLKHRMHYNSNSSIRGYKLYWHKSGDNWEETNENNIREHASQYTKIKPVKSNVHFFGKIRFENLSKVELGALLFALELPPGYYHKIGMGKPLGLGTIKIIPKLYLSDRITRYENLFSEWESNKNMENALTEFKRAFEQFVLPKINEKSVERLWETKKLQELKTILNYDKGLELELENKTRYMQITPDNEFKHRSILPKPLEI